MKNKILVIILLLATFFLLIPQLQIPWMIIDDGESARASAELASHFRMGDFGWLFKFEAQNGLLRPSYWLLHLLNFSLFGSSALLHHFGHLLLFMATAFLIFSLTREISGDKFAGLLSGLFLFLFFPAVENFYRLGTGEPGLILFLLGSFCFFIKAIKSNSTRFFFVSMLFLTLTWLAKATALVLIPISIFIVFLFFVFPEKKHPRSLKFCLWFLLTNLVLVLGVRWLMIIYQVEGGYGSQYGIDIQAILTRLRFYQKMIMVAYGPILYLALGSFAGRLIWKFKGKKLQLSWEDKWKLVMFALFACLLFIQTPWPHLMGRYLPPALIGLSVIAGIEISFLLKKALKFYEKDKKIITLPLLLIPTFFLVQFIFINSTSIYKRYIEVIAGETRRADVVKLLAASVPPNGRVYYNFSDGVVEFYYEMGLNFQFFYNRPDIQTNYLYLENGFSFQVGDTVVTGPQYSYRYPWDKVKNAVSEKQMLRNETEGWEVFKVLESKEVLPISPLAAPVEKKNLLKNGSLSFVDGQDLVVIPTEKFPLVGGEINFNWEVPNSITVAEGKIPLVRQGKNGEAVSNGLFIWAGKDYLTFGIFDPWREEWRSLIAKQEFLPGKNYEIMAKWGITGMILQVGDSYQFFPYYVKLNATEDIFLGPVLPGRPVFEEEIGEINEFKVFNR